MSKIETEIPDCSNPELAMHKPRASKAAAAGAILWFTLVIALTAAMTRYANRPGELDSTPLEWPAESAVPLAGDLPTLLMFVHPNCPCTRASVRELEVLLAQCGGKVRAHLLFLKPAGMSNEWVESDLWTRALLIPGVTAHVDELGETARVFGSRTSGHTVLYGTDGRLLFAGGITASRGHSGDNAGRSILTQALQGGQISEAAAPVFGCGLFDAACGEGEVECVK